MADKIIQMGQKTQDGDDNFYPVTKANAVNYEINNISASTPVVTNLQTYLDDKEMIMEMSAEDWYGLCMNRQKVNVPIEWTDFAKNYATQLIIREKNTKKKWGLTFDILGSFANATWSDWSEESGSTTTTQLLTTSFGIGNAKLSFGKQLLTEFTYAPKSYPNIVEKSTIYYWAVPQVDMEFVARA